MGNKAQMALGLTVSSALFSLRSLLALPSISPFIDLSSYFGSFGPLGVCSAFKVQHIPAFRHGRTRARISSNVLSFTFVGGNRTMSSSVLNATKSEFSTGWS